MPEKRYPVDSKDYKLYEEVGDGVSASVYRALCIPFNETVAIKVLDLERCNNDLGCSDNIRAVLKFGPHRLSLDGIRQEVHTMTLIDHPNVLRAHCSFAAGHNLWVVMPYMAGGSCMHIMKSTYPEGLEEPVIASLLRETLKALVYLHAHGHIHRDVKAGNILLDTNGTVKLGDFGVSACMFDSVDRQRSRNTFVGTPCWMAPEVMQQLHGYDFKADIWSFGITALELAHGHAPFSKHPPMKVLLMTLQNAPPGLDYERDKKFSKSFKELVAACLVKDPKKRPTSEKLLKHNFFKHAKTREYLTRTVLDGLPPLGERFRMLKAKEADLLEQNRALYGDKEHLSQQEYIRGISAWNFNLEDLKNQAALIQDDDSISCQENVDSNCSQNEGFDDVAAPVDKPSAERINGSNSAPNDKEAFDDIDSLDGSLASFPIQPLKALKGYFDVGEDDANGKNSSCEQSVPSDGDIQCSPKLESHQTVENDVVNFSLPKYIIPGQKKVFSGPLLPENMGSKRNIGEGDRESLHGRCPSNRNYSGTLLYRQKKDTNNSTSVEDTSDGSVKRRGRFKVTSADLTPQASTNNFFNPVSVNTAGQAQSISAASILPALQCILQQNNMQREEIVKLIKCVEQSSGNRMESADAMTNEISQTPPTSGEAELMTQAIQLQQRIGSLAEELQRQKAKNAQLEKRLNALALKE